MSLRERLNSMGIDGHRCEQLINLYHAFVQAYPSEWTIGQFIHSRWVQRFAA